MFGADKLLSSTALAFHNAQLEASAFREEFDPENFEDLTVPKYDKIHKVCVPPRVSDAQANIRVDRRRHLHNGIGNSLWRGQRVGPMMKEWKEALLQDESASVVVEPPAGSRRKTVRTICYSAICRCPEGSFRT